MRISTTRPWSWVPRPWLRTSNRTLWLNWPSIRLVMSVAWFGTTSISFFARFFTVLARFLMFLVLLAMRGTSRGARSWGITSFTLLWFFKLLGWYSINWRRGRSINWGKRGRCNAFVNSKRFLHDIHVCHCNRSALFWITKASLLFTRPWISR